MPPETVGVPGAPGGSFLSVTKIVTAMVSVPPWPSSALTVTLYSQAASWS